MYAHVKIENTHTGMDTHAEIETRQRQKEDRGRKRGEPHAQEAHTATVADSHTEGGREGGSEGGRKEGREGGRKGGRGRET
jgi:hypothetical protein